MAIPDSIAKYGVGLGDKLLFGSLIIFVIVFIFIVIAGIGFWLRYLKKFNVKVMIKSLRSSGAEGRPIYKLVPDKGGVIISRKDKSRWFRLRGEKVDLPLPPLECYEMDYKGVNHLTILQKGNEEYYYMLPGKITDIVIVKDGKEIRMPEQEMKVIDGDIAYWNQLRKRQDKKIFDIESTLMKLIPYILIGAMLIAVIFYTYIWLDKSAVTAAMTQDNLQAIERIATIIADTTKAQLTMG